MKHNKDSKKHYDNIVAAQEYISELRDKKQEAFDNKSEKWQESDAGEKAQEDIDILESLAETIQSAADEIDDAFSDE